MSTARGRDPWVGLALELQEEFGYSRLTVATVIAEVRRDLVSTDDEPVLDEVAEVSRRRLAERQAAEDHARQSASRPRWAR